MSLFNTVSKVENEWLKKKLLNAKEQTVPSIKSKILWWRNGQIALRIFISVISALIIPGIYFLWATYKNWDAKKYADVDPVRRNYFTEPHHATKEALAELRDTATEIAEIETSSVNTNEDSSVQSDEEENKSKPVTVTYAGYYTDDLDEPNKLFAITNKTITIYPNNISQDYTDTPFDSAPTLLAPIYYDTHPQERFACLYKEPKSGALMLYDSNYNDPTLILTPEDDDEITAICVSEPNFNESKPNFFVGTEKGLLYIFNQPKWGASLKMIRVSLSCPPIISIGYGNNELITVHRFPSVFVGDSLIWSINPDNLEDIKYVKRGNLITSGPLQIRFNNKTGNYHFDNGISDEKAASFMAKPEDEVHRKASSDSQGKLLSRSREKLHSFHSWNEGCDNEADSSEDQRNTV